MTTVQHTVEPDVGKARGPRRRSRWLRLLLSPPLRARARRRSGEPDWAQTVASWLASLVLHATFLVVVGLLQPSSGGGGGGPGDSRATYAAGPSVEDLAWEGLGADPMAIDPISQPTNTVADELASTGVASGVDGGAAPLETGALSNAIALDVATLAPSADAVAIGSIEGTGPPSLASDLSVGDLARGNSLSGRIGSGFLNNLGGGGGLSGRRGPARMALTGTGATPESEAAVERGLRWLQAHQHSDGGWRFDHTKGPCGGACSGPGSELSKTAATAIALLPFLGAGHTHEDGEFAETVRMGLYYLTGQVRHAPNVPGGDYRDNSTMYAHGLAAIALCEAYAMTDDPALKEPAQQALDFIVYAQHEPGGGWRYSPKEPGDTTVTGWQLMALKSGQMGYLRVPGSTIQRASAFLDSVSTERGAMYGYVSSSGTPACTAVGLLCRMYLGWPHDHIGLKRGVVYLAKHGPSPNDMYFNYYATQVLHHYGGTTWHEWNKVMRDYLIQTQSNTGHESGSWYFEHHHSHKGGRLYNTAMAIMTLEVYYRHMPLYTNTAVDGNY